MRVKYIVIFLLLVLFIQGFVSATFKSRTIDEINYHLQGGHSYLTTGEWVTGINNPPLTATLAALPLLFVKDKSVFNDFNKVKQEPYIQGTETPFPKHLLMLGRLVPLLFMVLLGYVVFLWARDLFGVYAGLFALFLYSFSPNILSFGRLVTADIGGALFIFAAMYTFWKYIKEPTKKHLVIAAIVFGLAQVAKMLAVFLIPTYILYAALIYFLKPFNVHFFPKIQKVSKKVSDLFISLMIVFLTGLFVINATYLFDDVFIPLKNYDPETLSSSTFKDMRENPLLNWIPIPLPEQYVRGHDQAQWQAKDEVRGFFFRGEVRERFKSYYLFHILIKTPIPIFILIILGFIIARKITLTDVYMIAFMANILILLTFFSKLLIGYRHILAIYPLFFVLSSKVFMHGIPKKRFMQILIGLLAVWYLVSSLLIFPHYLAYFNEFIGGPKNGYKYTIDSNLDWEQDLDLVKKYISKSDREILVDPGCVAWTGRAVIPANSLQFQKGACYQWLKQHFEPVDYIGYSWLVYDVSGTWQQTDQGFVFTPG